MTSGSANTAATICLANTDLKNISQANVCANIMYISTFINSLFEQKKSFPAQYFHEMDLSVSLWK